MYCNNKRTTTIAVAPATTATEISTLLPGQPFIAQMQKAFFFVTVVYRYVESVTIDTYFAERRLLFESCGHHVDHIILTICSLETIGM